MVIRSRDRLGGRAPTLGLLVDWLEDGYQRAIAAGAHTAAQGLGANLLCFTGGVLRSPVLSAAQRNHVYELAGPSTVDAVMLLSGTMGNYVGPEELSRFCDRYRALPMCSIAVELDGVPSVLVDNEVGMRSLIAHLIRVHKHRRIAFVRGPSANAEAERRFRAYKQALREEGVEVDARLITTGDFQPDSGREAVRILFDERRIKPASVDTIAAANDAMALGVMEALERRGIRVPGQIAVVGFDDIEDARYTKSPLTTVRQPLEEQGRRAVRMVLGALQDGRDAESVVLQTDLVVRASCGCFELKESTSGSILPPSMYGFEAALVERRERILAKLSRASRGSFAAAGKDWEVRLVNAFAAELGGGPPGGCAAELSATLEKVAARGVDVNVCHDVVTELRRQILPCLTNDPERRGLAEDVLHHVRRAASGTIERLLSRERLRLERWVKALGETGASMIATFDLSALVDVALERFPSLGITSCFVALYQGEGAPSRDARLVLLYDRLAPHPSLESAVFPSRDLLPQELLGGGERRRSFVVLPLFLGQEILGFMIVELEMGQTFALEAVRDLVGAALKGAELAEQASAAQRERDGAAREREGALRERESAVNELQRERVTSAELERALMDLRSAMDTLSGGGLPPEVAEAVRRVDAALGRLRVRKATARERFRDRT